MARLPTRPDEDGSSASDVLVQYVDAEYASPPDRLRRAKDEAAAKQSAAKWAKWVGSSLRASLDDELRVQRAQSPQDTVRIAALEAALLEIKGW